MKKRRYLRESIEKLLIGFEIALFMLLVAIDDFNVNGIDVVIIGLSWLLFFGVAILLKNYGKLIRDVMNGTRENL